MQPRIMHLLGRLGLDPWRVPASNMMFVRSARSGSGTRKGSLVKSLLADAQDGYWRNLDADAKRGTAAADINTHGLVGGAGLVSKIGEIGAFIGYLDSNQSLAGLGTKVEASGVVGGVYGDFTFGNIGLHALLAYDRSDADMSRGLSFVGQTATSKFDVDSWTADISTQYTARLSERWSLQPSVGLTYMRTVRSATKEDGTPFALDIEKETTEAWFADASLSLAGSFSVAAKKVTPYISVGLRHQFDGEGVIATARLAGVTAGALTVDGAGRPETAGTLGAGAGIDLTDRLRLQAGYNAELASSGNRHNASVRLNLNF